MISTIVQPSPEASVATDSASNIIPQILTIMQNMQQLMVQIKADQVGGGYKTTTATPIFLPLTSQQQNPDKGNPQSVTRFF